MALKKDKEKVLDEVWTEERVRGFLDVEAPAGVERDFHTLLKAYQQMRADDFALFISMFLAEKRDINARDNHGQTVLDIISEHRCSGAFVETLRTAGATRGQ